MKVTGMLKSINSGTIIMIILILFSLSLLGNVHEAKADTSVVQEGSAQGIILCPSGKKYEADIAFEALSEASSSPYTVGHASWSIKSPNARTPNYERTFGVIATLTISPTGQFILTGKETHDDICGSLVNVGSTPIEITGECRYSGTASITVNFRADNGQIGYFPSRPICTIN